MKDSSPASEFRPPTRASPPPPAQGGRTCRPLASKSATASPLARPEEGASGPSHPRGPTIAGEAAASGHARPTRVPCGRGRRGRAAQGEHSFPGPLARRPSRDGASGNGPDRASATHGPRSRPPRGRPRRPPQNGALPRPRASPRAARVRYPRAGGGACAELGPAGRCGGAREALRGVWGWVERQCRAPSAGETATALALAKEGRREESHRSTPRASARAILTHSIDRGLRPAIAPASPWRRSRRELHAFPLLTSRPVRFVTRPRTRGIRCWEARPRVGPQGTRFLIRPNGGSGQPEADTAPRCAMARVRSCAAVPSA